MEKPHSCGDRLGAGDRRYHRRKRIGLPLLRGDTIRKANRSPFMALFFLDLTRRPPRSPRVRLGGYVCLPRLLDKGRAQLAGKAGDYRYNCPIDQRWFSFTGLSSDALLAELAKGKSDGELLAWIAENAPLRRAPWEISAWSAYMEARAPGDAESHRILAENIEKLAPDREDIIGWFDLLDLDDYVSFGGKA